VILPAQALHQHRRHCLPAVSHDFARLGANFARIGADFARVYPRPLYKKALAAPLPSTESAVMALKHRITTVTLSQTKKPAPQEGGIGADFASRLPYRVLSGSPRIPLVRDAASRVGVPRRRDSGTRSPVARVPTSWLHRDTRSRSPEVEGAVFAPWQRPVIQVTLRHGDQDTRRVTTSIPAPPDSGTRVGHLAADLPTAQAHVHTPLPRGPASPRDVPCPGHSGRPDRVRPTGLGRA
jgi:hypothetical protein